MSGARSITLILKGRWFGCYGQARCPAHGDRSPSLSLADGTDGRLLAYCHAGCEFVAIVHALRRLGLLDGRSSVERPRPADLARLRADEEAEARKREAQARACWAGTRPISDVIAQNYFRTRGIACELPPTLRFHPACWHASAERLPAVVALVEGAERFAVHRTYLRPDGSGKADVEPAKAMLGTVVGGAVRLASPSSSVEVPLVVAEGIETVLSLASGLLRGPAEIWAALSTSGLRSLNLPSRPGQLTIASDGDKAGREAAHALAARADALGWNVSLLPAPEGRDWNDVLRLGAKMEGAQ